MARADLLIDLVKAGMAEDRNKLQKVVESIVAEKRAKKHNILADRLERLLRSEPKLKHLPTRNVLLDQKVTELVCEIVPTRTFEDLILPKEVLEISREVVQEYHKIDLLRSYNLEPRHRLLLIGPPGNGKTSLAEAFAQAFGIPLFLVRYEGIVRSLLGETAARLGRLWEYVSTRKCVLFFDEFETLGKDRGDQHEAGEIRRVVSSLLKQMDRLPSHVVVIGATNHAELLDSAAWRRFQVRMELPKPTLMRLTEWFVGFEQRIGVPLGYAPEELAKELYGVNFAEAEEFGSSIFRRYVLAQPGAHMKNIIDNTLQNWAVRTAKTERKE